MARKNFFLKKNPNKKEKALKLIHSLVLAKDNDIETWYDE